MERVGIVVSSIEMGTAKLDGLCNWSEPDGRPHVLLATDKMSFVRRQMDAAHELAHAVLHRDVTEEDLRKDLKEIERQAFRLASAFLLPGTIYPREVVRPSLAMLHTLKERWRVSIKAQIRRLEDLAIITSEYARELYKLYSAKGWNREEPMDRQWAVPEPRVLADAMTVIVESGVRTKADLMSVEFTIPAGDVENLANLHPGWFEGRTGEVVQLKREVQPAEARGQAGAVLPFSRRR